MSAKYYCYKCGWVQDVGTYYTLPVKSVHPETLFCSKCRIRVLDKPPAHVTAMQEEIAGLKTLTSMPVFEINRKQQEEIAALRAEKLTDASALRLALERIAELEKVVEALLSRSKVFGASGLTHEEAKALREAGYLKEEG